MWAIDRRPAPTFPTHLILLLVAEPAKPAARVFLGLGGAAGTFLGVQLLLDSFAVLNDVLSSQLHFGFEQSGLRVDGEVAPLRMKKAHSNVLRRIHTSSSLLGDLERAYSP